MGTFHCWEGGIERGFSNRGQLVQGVACPAVLELLGRWLLLPFSSETFHGEQIC